MHENAPMHTKAIFERVFPFLFSPPFFLPLIYLFLLFVYIVAFVSQNVIVENVGIKKSFENFKFIWRRVYQYLLSIKRFSFKSKFQNDSTHTTFTFFFKYLLWWNVTRVLEFLSRYWTFTTKGNSIQTTTNKTRRKGEEFRKF